METEDPRRRILINSLSAGLLTLLVNPRAAHADAVYAEKPGKLPPGQSIYRLRGRVFVNDQEASLDTHVGPNAEVRTGTNSEAIFVVGGHAMLVRENTDLLIKGAEVEEASFIVSALRLLTGKLLAVSRNQKYVLHTPTATIGIRGTGVYAETEPDLTYLCTCYGKTSVFARNDPLSRETVVATHHNHPLYISAKGKPGKHIQRAGFKNHTDEELLLIETIVGRTTPFKVPYDGPNPYLNDSP
ncbi:MAG TPA: hypothetical protein VNW52_11160 [Burkholderiaceae bacterium]|jgi:hypothetical protein|nr:hypothetical protein [Burkholderiaceae bacterium]